jgi:hypothetical protein
MKLSTLIVLVLLGLVAFMLLGSKGKVSAFLSKSDSTELSEPTGARKTAGAKVTSEPLPIPTVHATNLAVVRGLVVDVVAGRAIIDCDYVAQLSPQSLAAWNNTARAGGGGVRFAEMAQKQADRETFGSLQVMDERGVLQDSEFQPQNRIRGQATLAGIPLKKGASINVVAAPMTVPGVQGTIYTARFQTTGGTWMWNGKSNPLEKRAKRL